MVKKLVHFITQTLSSSEQFGDVNVEVDLAHHSDPRKYELGVKVISYSFSNGLDTSHSFRKKNQKSFA